MRDRDTIAIADDNVFIPGIGGVHGEILEVGGNVMCGTRIENPIASSRIKVGGGQIGLRPRLWRTWFGLRAANFGRVAYFVTQLTNNSGLSLLKGRPPRIRERARSGVVTVRSKVARLALWR